MKRIQSIMKTKQPRRGALLLVVLSILVLFALVGLTFVVSALAFNTGAQANLERDLGAYEAPNEADAALMQLLRGPRLGTKSTMLGHDILRDMWGNQSVWIQPATAINIDIEHPEDSTSTDINQFYEITLTDPNTSDSTTLVDALNGLDLFLIEQYYTGSVLTFTSGELKGQSHRIVHYRMKFITDMSGTRQDGVVFVIDQDPIVARENLVDTNGDGGISPVDGDSFVVNDPAFNGTGYGYNPEAPTTPRLKRTLDLVDSDDDPVALLPNILNSFPLGMASGYSIESGGADESYDAPDYQNMYLAYIDGGHASSTAAIMPSFHRQDLLKYWRQQIAKYSTDNMPGGSDVWMTLSDAQKVQAFEIPYGNDGIKGNGDSAWDITPFNDKIAKVTLGGLLRPSKFAHPNFTGSNPDFNMFAETYGTSSGSPRWDIDNDLDGYADSIWIDIGLPLKTDRQGRRYRPLAAIMVKDLDGLINVNTDGFYSQFAEFEGSSFPPASTATPNDATTLLLASSGMTNQHNQYSPSWDSAGTTAQNMQLVLGSGYGPADVSLRQIFGAREAFDLMDARYKGISPFTSTTGTPGQDTVDDVRSRMDTIGLLGDYDTSTGLWPSNTAVTPNFLVNNRFGTPTDRLGLGRMYIDYAGRPRYQPEVAGTRLGRQTPPTGFTERIDDPYEFDPIHGYRYDSPFSYQELERVLRYEEYDSSSVAETEDRLMELANASLTGSPTNRRLITTASFQVPTANRVDIPYDLRDEDSGSGTPQNMMFAGKAAQASRPAPTLVTLLQERLRKENPTSFDPSTVAGAKLLKEKIYQLLPPEIMRGEPFDLNRMLEAPADSSTDNIFDLQNSANITFQSLYGTSGAQTPNSQFVNWLNGTSGVGCNSPTLPTPINASNPISYSASRQMMARYLYVMVLLLMEDDYQLPTIDPDLMTDVAKRRELTKRRIAQWAINVVDFRDRDAVMTPFEYDLNPFKVEGPTTTNDPWNVDGNLTTPEDITYRRVVWGAEAPDLVLSETLAFHDRRTKDTKWDTDGKSRFSTTDPDEDLDQYRIPQGSLFIELYNPRNLQSNNNYFPRELYDLGTDFGLALDRKTPGGDPVWRIVITKSELDTSDMRTRENIVKEIADRPDYINFQPLPDMGTADPAGFAMDGTNVSKEQYDIERIILFTTPNTTPDAKVFFYPGNSARRIVPDSYAVIGPRQTTYIGSKPRPTGMGTTDYAANNPGAQSIILSGASEGVYVSSNMLAPTGGSRKGNNQDFAVVATKPDTISIDDLAHDPDGLPGAGGAPYSTIGIGLSVSEPLQDDYYPAPTFQNSAPNLAVFDLYTDGAAGTIMIQDVPFDTDPTPDNPLAIDSTISDTGTYPDKSIKGNPEFIKDYKTAILQRLANPLSNYNDTTNPYISVDHLGIDLTVFNGEDSHAAANAMDQLGTPGTDPGANDWDPDENGKNPRTTTDVYFASREKGRREDGDPNNTPVAAELEGGTSSGNYLGTLKRLSSAITIGDITSLLPSFNETPPIHQSTVDTTLVTNNPITDEHFGRKVVHTLGYVNRNLGAQIGTGVDATYLASPNPFESAHSLNPYDSTAGTTACENNPLSYMHWPNAPFISEYDLMMVPTSSPQRLLFEYSQARKNASNSGDEPFYFQSGATSPTNGDKLDAQLAPYAYLFNFFHGTKTDGLTATPGNDEKAMQLARLFDFVHVPSRFNGTNKWFNISQFNPTDTDLRTVSTKTEDARLGYMFPFNRRSEFREPGKINLNTIPSELVYNSIFDPTFWQSGDFNFASWTEFQESRRGYTGATDPAYPSYFSNPFRPAAAAEMMPVLHSTNSDPKRLLVPPEEAGLLRSVDRNVATPSDRRPLFDLRLNDPSLGNDKMRHYRTDDNPMLRYQAYQRLGNIAGTQSNVFAVWITIGYFEVEPVAVSPTHPDGWRLAEELGNDTGEINRHRAFYIIDRSIPVGYVPGEDLNVEDTIMLKRFIE